MSKEIILSWFGEKLFISLILLIIFLLGAMIGAIIASKTRIKKLENKIVKLEVLDDKATQIWEQIKTIKQFKESSERLETSMSLKTVNVVNGSGSLAKNIAEERHQGAESSKPLKTVNVVNGPGSLAKNIAEERHQRAEPSKYSKASRKRYSKASRKRNYTVRDADITSPPL